MKKTLLLQTALVAAAGLFVADVASAQTKATPIGVTVGGYYTSFYKVQDRDKAANNAGNTDQSTQALGQDAEIWFNIRGVLDNGTVIGGRVELEGTTYADQIDETYLFVEKADIGRMEIGATDRVTGKMLYFAPNALPGHSTTVNSEYSAANVQPLMWFSNSGHDNEGINLYTASNRYFGSKTGKGLQLGVSYVPNGCQDFSGCAGGFSSTADAGQLSQQFAAAANYIESFGSVDAALYAGYTTAHIEGTLGTGVTDPRQDGWQVGAQFTYNVGDGSTVQLGGGYSAEDVGRDADSTASGGVIKDRKAYSVGLRYLTNGAAPGSVGIGAEYYNRKDDLTTAGTEDKLNYYTLGVTYQIAAGMLTFAGVGVSDAKYAAATNDPKQTFGVVGLALNF
ncbi:porin [Ferrovibrio sp.]|uniref:porin n=1 Tax=Ferrovibrio sp. TaxID=1917215 RepID=UPI00261B2B10|nr:porin [Ferrovibrio sp.]